MERHEMNLGAMRSASAAVIVPIAGMVGGLIIGGFRARGPMGELSQLIGAIRWGVTGFFGGLALVMLLALQLRREDVVSIRKLMVLVVIAAVIAWFFARVLFSMIGYAGF